jgi:hypothetical protein
MTHRSTTRLKIPADFMNGAVGWRLGFATQQAKQMPIVEPDPIGECLIGQVLVKADAIQFGELWKHDHADSRMN